MVQKRFSILVAVWMSCVFNVHHSIGQDPPPRVFQFGNGLPTAGGRISWTDEVIHGQWRIQKHTVNNRYRLLDPHERRMAYGTFEQCFAELNRRRDTGQIAPMTTSVVLVIHGLGGSRSIMEDIAKHLRDAGNLQVISFGYASSQGLIQDHAVALESVLRNLHSVQQVSVVAHSMGNLVVRKMLFNLESQGNPMPIQFVRMVMISPPNHGVELADGIGQRRLFQLASGEVINQFARHRDWPQLEQQLATPDFAFGIIAGGRGNDRGYLSLIDGDDDGLLSLETQQLDGATEFLQTGGFHQLMTHYPSVQQATLSYLQTGHF